MRKAKLQAIYLMIFFISLGSGFTSCTKVGASGVNTSGPAFSYITTMNLAPYGDSAYVYFGGNEYPGGAIPVGSYSTSYFKVASGSFDVEFKTPSSDSLLAEIPSSPFDSLGFYTLIVYNDSSNGIAKAAKITDNFSNVTNDSAYIRFFNLSPDMPSVDLYINSTKVQSARTPADNILNTFYNNFQAIPNGYYTIEAKQAGTNIVVGTVLNGSLLNGQVYTIFLEELHGNSGNSFGLSILQFSDN